MASSTKLERRLVHYSGHVQGVGFRYTTCEIASRFAVTGYVRNLPDGRVELVAEGTCPELQALLQVIRTQMGHNIQDESCHSLEASQEYNQFNIRY